MVDYIRFAIPVSVDQFGFTEHKTVVASRRMLPFAPTDGGGILFTAQATAMPLLDKGIER